MNDSLVLITNNFPFGKGETFIENEIIYLAKKFKSIIIVSHNTIDKQTRLVPENVILERYDNDIKRIEKIFALKNFLNPLVWQEYFFIKKKLNLKFSFFKLKTLLITLYKSKKISKLLKNIISQYEIDKNKTIFYSYWMDDNALALAKDKSIRKICRTHRWDLFFEQNKEFYLPLRKYILDNIICFSISEYGKDYLESKIGIENIQIARLGTKNLSLNTKISSQKIILSCSHIIKRKRIGLIAEALSICKTEGVKWIHFGDGPLYSEINSLSESLSIDFELKGNVSNGELLNYYQNENIDLFINVSESEGVPVSVMEAYSCGIPALATDVDSTFELVNNENGTLLSSNPSTVELALEIDNFFSLTEEDVMKKRKNALHTWETKYNAEKNYTEFADIILNL